MSKNNMTLKERETRRISILIHNASTTIFNSLKEEDFSSVHTTISSMSMETIMHDYYRYIDQFNLLYEDDDTRKLTIFDKALCLAMSMEAHPIIGVSTKGKKPARLTDLNAKAIASTVVDFLHASKYIVKGAKLNGIYDLRVFDDGHKKELKQLKTLLAEEFKKVNFDYNTCLAILVKVYSKGIIYQNGLDTELEVKIAENLSIKDNVDAYGIQVNSSPQYQEYKNRFKR